MTNGVQSTRFELFHNEGWLTTMGLAFGDEHSPITVICPDNAGNYSDTITLITSNGDEKTVEVDISVIADNPRTRQEIVSSHDGYVAYLTGNIMFPPPYTVDTGETLMIHKSNTHPWEARKYKTFLQFYLGGVDLSHLASAKLRLRRVDYEKTTYPVHLYKVSDYMANGTLDYSTDFELNLPANGGVHIDDAMLVSGQMPALVEFDIPIGQVQNGVLSLMVDVEDGSGNYWKDFDFGSNDSSNSDLMPTLDLEFN